MPWHRIATEGATTDGRTISADWLTQMAKNFDPAKYGCRLNLEHIKGVLPDSPFKAYGDVTALKAEKGDDGKMALFAEIDPTDELKALVDKRQKIYTSMEVDLDFAGSGEAYLVGLAVTDTPASLGTSMLKFSAEQGQDSPLAARKQRPDNLFSAAIETVLDFSEEPQEETGPNLLDTMKALFAKHSGKHKHEFAAFQTDLQHTLALFVEKHTALEGELAKRPTGDAFSTLQAAHDELKQRFDELFNTLDNEPASHHHRARATGTHGGAIVTDC